MECDRDGAGESGAILIEYGMILVAVLLVSFALVGLIGGEVVGMFNRAVDLFG
ncbi:MAG: Flp family type IVb pilin [Acidobacteria bacterium]|nr:Flp family type IVb pilin [Acidobacteriota bacterium]